VDAKQSRNTQKIQMEMAISEGRRQPDNRVKVDREDGTKVRVIFKNTKKSSIERFCVNGEKQVEEGSTFKPCNSKDSGNVYCCKNVFQILFSGEHYQCNKAME